MTQFKGSNRNRCGRADMKRCDQNICYLSNTHDIFKDTDMLKINSKETS